MNNIDTISSYSEQIEISPKLSNDSISNFSEKNSIYKDNEISYINEFYNGRNNGINFYDFATKKQRNKIDYLNISDEEYKKQKCYKKISLMLNGLNELSKNILDEIVYLSWYYYKKLSNKRLTTIVPIITYKILQKYDIQTVSLKDLKTKINFSYKKYFKNEKLFGELNSVVRLKMSSKNYKYNNNINNIIYSIKQPYSELVFNSFSKYINLLKDKSQKPVSTVKINKKKLSRNKNNKLIESLYTKISKDENDINELYTNPTIIELNKCLDECKSLIYNAKKICTDNNKDELMSETNATNQTINLKEENAKIYWENTFNNFFQNKIDKDTLALGLVKYLIDKSEIISLSYKKMNDIFNCSIYKIKKAILYITDYFNYINKIE